MSFAGRIYPGIFFFDTDSDSEDILSNVIEDALDWALELVMQMPNNLANNLTNLPARYWPGPGSGVGHERSADERPAPGSTLRLARATIVPYVPGP